MFVYLSAVKLQHKSIGNEKGQVVKRLKTNKKYVIKKQVKWNNKKAETQQNGINHIFLHFYLKNQPVVNQTSLL